MEWLKENRIYVIAVIIAILFFLYNSFDQEGELTEGNQEALAMVAENESNADEKTEKEADEAEIIMMADIKGAVVNPGVYEVKEGGRVIDLIELAGGLEKDADSSVINFAMYVQDEMALYVPRIGEQFNAALPIQAGEAAGNGLVNINSADSSELQTLPGIGPAKADAIIEYRETNGPFNSKEGLKDISGIGEKTFEKLEDLISVK